MEFVKLEMKRHNLTFITVGTDKTVLATTRTHSTNMVTCFLVNTVSTTFLFTIHAKVSGLTLFLKKNIFGSLEVLQGSTYRFNVFIYEVVYDALGFSNKQEKNKRYDN